jgi:large subunit ribosomal protein L25
MQQETLEARPRTELGTRPSKRSRRAGRVPAVVYGRGLQAMAVTVERKQLYTVLHTEAGLNALINVEVDGGDTVLAVAREIQRHPVLGDITHLDFIKVSLDETITAEVALEYTGTPAGVKEDGGFVEAIENTVAIEALPTAIPNSIELDISELGINDTLRVSDLPELDGVTYIDEPDRPLVTVLPPRVEEEAPVLEGEELLEGEEVPAEEAPEEAAEPTEGEE